MGTVRDKDGNERELKPEKPLNHCADCKHTELYTRKDFPKSLGITTIVIAAILTLYFENYWFLFGAALVDAVLYWMIPEVYVCYQCHSEHRKIPFDPKPAIFDIAISDRHKFGASYKGPRSTND